MIYQTSFGAWSETTELLGSGIYKIKEVRAGPDKLWQANYVLRTLPEGPKIP